MNQESPSCPKCGERSNQIRNGRTAANSQRYKCKICLNRYTPNPQEIGYDEEVRLQALRLYLEGVSLRGVSRILSVNHQSVANWINRFANTIPMDMPPSILETAILDGIYENLSTKDK